MTRRRRTITHRVRRRLEGDAHPTPPGPAHCPRCQHPSR